MKAKLKVITIIQARLGSARLPGKVLLPILGKPMVEQIADRIAYAKTVDQTVLATSDEKQDDELVAFAESIGLTSSRGAVDDLALRLNRAAVENNADVLVRCWADCPCVDPELIDKAVTQLLVENLDYISNSVTVGRSYPYGLDIEVYRSSVLAEIDAKTDDPFYREFPCEYVKAKDHFIKGEFRCDNDYSDLFVTVDYAKDLELIRHLFADLQKPDRAFNYQEIITWFETQDQNLAEVSALPRNIEYYEKKQQHHA